MKHILCLLCAWCALGVSAQAQNTACTATATMPDQYETEIVSYYIYTGDEANAPFTETITVDLTPNRVTWKKQPDPNCGTGNPEDCMVWTPVETDGESIELTIVSNINKQTQYIKEQFSRQKLVREGGFTASVPIICENDITPSMMYDVSMRLTDMGYYSGLIYSVLNSKVKAALEKFQRHNGLPVGHLDKATIEALELNWPYGEKAEKASGETAVIK